jgi:UDP-glucose 4-epimerase
MRVLVTGSSGFVGSIIAGHLQEIGHQVVGLSRRPNRTLSLPEVIHLDISDVEINRLSKGISPCEAIVHAAASVSYELFSPSISLTNCLGTQKMLELSSTWKSSSFIFISSIQVIGQPLHLPLSEDHQTRPMTAYHASKLYGEHLTRLSNRNGLTTTVLRLTSPVGPHMPENRIFSVFIRNALDNKPLKLTGHGTRKQNYVDVRDVARSVELCLSKNMSGLFHVAADECISNYDLAKLCVNKLNSFSNIEFRGIPDPEEGIVWDISIDKARRRLGFSPQYKLAESILDVAAEYSGH